MGHGRQENIEAGGGAKRETRETQPVATSNGNVACQAVVFSSHEFAGERVRRRRRLHLHGAVSATPES